MKALPMGIVCNCGPQALEAAEPSRVIGCRKRGDCYNTRIMLYGGRKKYYLEYEAGEGK